jgi:HlyD family secretion protein
MADRSIFRKAALARLSSPERLDQLMQVTDPRGWIALIGLCMVLLAAGVWSIVGRIPTTIQGTGILLSSEGIREIESLGSGVVSELRVDVGDRIDTGDTIALVRQPRLAQEVEQARQQLEVLEENRGRRADFTSTHIALETESLDRERADLERRVSVTDERIAWLTDRLEAAEEAERLGLVTPAVVQDERQQLEAARGERTGLDLQLQNNDIARLLLDNESSSSLNEADTRIDEARAELDALTLQLQQSSTVLSPYSGFVREIRTDVGQIVSGGQAVVSVEMVDAPLQAVIYVPTEGKRIEAGMSARVSPVTVRREEFGFMVGEVEFVSPQPATPEGMQRTLGNPILVQQLTSLGAPFLVRVDLREDPTTPSGFRWSSSQGPSRPVESGTSVSVEVVVEEQRPISLVIPLFRSALGTT